MQEFHQAKPMKGAWVQGVGWRWDEGQGGSYNPMAWAYGGTVDQNKSGADGKLVEKTKLIGMQVGAWGLCAAEASLLGFQFRTKGWCKVVGQTA